MELTAETATEKMADVLVIAGDISETQDQTLQAIERLQSLCDFPVYYVRATMICGTKTARSVQRKKLIAFIERICDAYRVSRVILEKDGRQLALVVMWLV